MAESKARTAYFDNARYWLILLVVAGHMVAELYHEVPLARQVYLWIYAFHMPAFVLITGYLSRNFTWTAKSARRTVETILVPYFLFEITSQLVLRHYRGEPNPYDFFVPQWLGWFLMALFIWRVLTPVFQALRRPVLVATAISLLTPLIEVPATLALHKTLGLLPFYVLGMALTQAHFERLRALPYRLAGAGTLGLAFVAVSYLPQDWNTNWLKWKRTYEVLGSSWAPGMLERTGWLLAGVVLTAAFLSLVSWAHSWQSTLGARTLYAYILHGYLIVVADEQFHLFHHAEGAGSWGLLALLAAAAPLATLLLTRPIQWCFRPLLEPNLGFAFKRPDQARPPG